MKRSILYILIVLIHTQIIAKTWYVHVGNGSDTYSGLKQTPDGSGGGPYQSIKKAISSANDFDTITLVSAIFNERLVFDKSLYINPLQDAVISKMKLDKVGGTFHITGQSKLTISDTLEGVNGICKVEQNAKLIVGVNCAVINFNNNSFVQGTIGRLISGFDNSTKLFPIGTSSKQFRPIIVELKNSFSGIDTLWIGHIKNTIVGFQQTSISHVQKLYHTQIRLSNNNAITFNIRQPFGTTGKDDQVRDSANLMIATIQSGNSGLTKPIITNFSGKSGDAQWNLSIGTSVIAFSLGNLINGGNALNNDGVYAFFTTSKTNYCLKENIHLQSNSIVNGSNVKEALWYFNYPQTQKRNSKSGDSTNYNLIDTGKVDVWLIVTDNQLRMDTFIRTISVVPTAIKDIRSSNLCPEQFTQFSPNGKLDAKQKFSWIINPPVSPISQDSIYRINQLPDTVFSIKLTIQSPTEGCTYHLDSIFVPYKKLEISNIDIQDSCFPQGFEATPVVQYSGNPSSLKYDWVCNNSYRSVLANTRIFSLKDTSDDSWTVHLKVVSESGCSANDTIQIDRKYVLIKNVTKNTICGIDSLTLSPEIKASDASSINAHWFNKGFQISTLKNLNISRIDTIQNVKLLVTSPHGCQDSTTIELDNYLKGIIQIKNMNTKSCLTDSLELLVTRNSLVMQSGLFLIEQLSFNSNPTTIKSSNSQTVVQFLTTDFGCSDTITSIIELDSKPIHSLRTQNFDSVFCENELLDLKVFKTVGDKNYSSAIYDERNQYLGDTLARNLPITKAGIYMFHSEIKSKKSECSYRDTLKIRVLPIPKFSIACDTGLCLADSFRFELKRSSLLSNPPFQFSISVGQYQSNSSKGSLKFNSAGNQLLEWEISDSFGCLLKDSIKINVHKDPEHSLSFIGSMPMCFGDSILVNIASNDSIFWNGIHVVKQPIVLKSGGINQIDIATIHGCKSNSNFQVIADSALKMTVSNDTSIVAGNKLTLTATGVSSYKWYPIRYLIGKTGLSIIVQPSSNITYYVEGQSSLGCTIKDSIRVEVKENIRVAIQNLITDNGDGFNDAWNLSQIKDIEQCVIRVYQPFNSTPVKTITNYANNWTGSDLKSGQYYFEIERNNKIIHSGSLEILR